MTFGSPGLALAAVAAVALPILIHLLFRRRRRPVEWAAMELLRRALRRDRRRQRVERWLLLAARCLLVLLAGLGVAEPLLGAAAMEGFGARTLWIVIDDGPTSAERLPDGSTALSRSVDAARSLMAGLRSADTVGVVTAGGEARRAVAPATADKSRAEAFLRSLQPQWRPSDLPRAMEEAVNAARAEGATAAQVFLASGFRRGAVDLSQPLAPLPLTQEIPWTLLALRPEESSSTNAWAASVEPLRTGGEAWRGSARVMRLRVQRAGRQLPASTVGTVVSISGLPDPASKPLEFSAGEQAATVDVAVRGDERTDAVYAGVRASVDRDAQPMDDIRWSVVPTERALRVLVADRRAFGGTMDLERLSAGAWVARALEPGTGGRMEVQEVDPGSVDAAALRGTDAVVVARPDLLSEDSWRQLRTWVDAGGVLLLLPASGDGAQRWADRAVSALGLPWKLGVEAVREDPPRPLSAQQPASRLLRLIGSELSVLAAPVTAARRLPIEVTPTEAEVALVFNDGSPALVAGRSRQGQRGLVMVLAVAPELEWTDLPVKPLMVPLMQELVQQGREIAGLGGGAQVGDRPSLPTGATSIQRKPVDAADAAGTGSARLVAGADGLLAQPLEVPGVYDVLDAGGRVITGLAVNVDPARTSIEPQEPEAVAAWLGTSGPWRWADGSASPAAPAGVLTGRHGSLGAYLLMAALAVAAAETLLARRFSRASRVEAA